MGRTKRPATRGSRGRFFQAPRRGREGAAGASFCRCGVSRDVATIFLGVGGFGLRAGDVWGPSLRGGSARGGGRGGGEGAGGGRLREVAGACLRALEAHRCPHCSGSWGCESPGSRRRSEVRSLLALHKADACSRPWADFGSFLREGAGPSWALHVLCPLGQILCLGACHPFLRSWPTLTVWQFPEDRTTSALVSAYVAAGEAFESANPKKDGGAREAFVAAFKVLVARVEKDPQATVPGGVLLTPRRRQAGLTRELDGGLLAELRLLREDLSAGLAAIQENQLDLLEVQRAVLEELRRI
nr:hypothetical protein CFP56_02545 [Quercus suber]